MERRDIIKLMGLGVTAGALASPLAAQDANTAPAGALASSPWPAPRVGTPGADAMLGHCRVGSGPTVCIVLHEWLGDHVNWEPTLPYFDPGRYTLVFADLRGYGWSRALTGRFDLAEAAVDVLRLADQLQISRFCLVGHSMSGLIAQQVAVEAGSRIESVTLFSPVPPAGFHADEAALRALNAVIDEDDAAARAITARTSNRYGAGWTKRKLAIARTAATPEAMRGYLKMFTTASIHEPAKLTMPLHVVSVPTTLHSTAMTPSAARSRRPIPTPPSN
jgi:3-oxoadipate enol-lactonase